MPAAFSFFAWAKRIEAIPATTTASHISHVALDMGEDTIEIDIACQKQPRSLWARMSSRHRRLDIHTETASSTGGFGKTVI